ncbi:MAG: ABC transporter substrate-binding protein [Caldilinea sp.]
MLSVRLFVFVRAVSLLLLLTLFLTSCSPVNLPLASPAQNDAQAVDPIVVTDALDRMVTLPEPPARIVLAGRAVIMLADALYAFSDVGPKVVALSDTTQGTRNFIDLLDPTYGDKTIFSVSDVTVEEIAAAQPDLVIMKSFMAGALGDPLAQLGIPTLYVDLETPEQYARDLTTLGQVLGQPVRGQALVERYRSEAASVQAQLADLTDDARPRTLLLYYSDRGGEVAFNVAPTTWMQTRLVEMAGGVPVWADAAESGGWTIVNFEQVAAWDPDAIFIVHYRGNSQEVVDQLRADAAWQQLRAVQSDQLYGFPADFYSWDQPDVRWTLGLRWLASKLHPDRFADYDIAAEMERFYQQLYGLDAATVAAEIMPVLQGSVE